jgi:hypothetical protein
MRTAMVLALFCLTTTPGLAANGTITVEPFTAYSGESGDLRVVGSKVDSPIGLPHHIGCPQDTGVQVDAALQTICAPGKAYYNSLGSSGGARCGFGVYAGVCVKWITAGSKGYGNLAGPAPARF